MFICKNCGSQMRFDPACQKLVCTHCSTAVSPHEYKENRPVYAEERKLSKEEIPYVQPDILKQEEAEPIFKDDSADIQEAATYQATLMTCPQCGGQLLTTDETAATFCSFCGSSVLLESRVSRERRPDYIIPFRKTKEDCLAAYKKALRRSLYVPSDMFQEDQIERFRGIYMPYWVYSFEKKGSFSKKGCRSRRRGDYIYTKHYNLKSEVDASYDGLSFDASSSFSDNLSEAIAPFEFTESEPFEPGYLSGFYADTSDVQSSVYQEQAREIAKNHAASRLSRDSSYGKYDITHSQLCSSFPLRAGKPKLAMYPVWFLASRSKNGDRICYAAVNGQTGKVAADLPVDRKKMLIGTAILAIPIFFLLNLLFTLTPVKALVITTVMSFISMILANRQLNLIYCFEKKLDDKGYQSIYDPWGKNAKRKGSSFLSSGGGSMRVTVIVIISILLISVISALGVPCSGLLTVIILFLLIKGIVKPAGRKTKKTGAVAAAAPLGEKMKTLWKPIFGIAASIAIIVIAPASDLYYYGAAIVSMIFAAWSFWDILNMHNRLSSRPLPQFNKRGGEEYENH